MLCCLPYMGTFKNLTNQTAMIWVFVLGKPILIAAPIIVQSTCFDLNITELIRLRLEEFVLVSTNEIYPKFQPV